MADPVLFQIEDGVLAFAVVDRSAPGYTDSWQAPGGLGIEDVSESDYDPNAAGWKCQTTSGALTASPDTTTTDVPATFCAPAKTVPTPGETSYNLDVEYLQDPTVKVGLSRFLFEHDTEEAYFLLGLDDGNPPKAIGRVRVQAGAFGGAARTTLTATLSLPLSRRPQIEFGTATDSEAVPPSNGSTITPTGATPGTPGSFTPTGATPPANLGALQALGALGQTTAWTTGQYVVLGDSSQAHWDGDSWETGTAP